MEKMHNYAWWRFFTQVQNESIRRKVFEREHLFATMMNLLDVKILLGFARDLDHPDTPSAKMSFKKNFGGRKRKFSKHNFEIKYEVEDGIGSKPITPKSQVMWPKRIDAKEATKKIICFKC